MWYCYILKCADGSLYTGVTKNLKRRIDEHNHSSKGAKYTRLRRPVRLLYNSRHKSRSLAQKKESRIKKLKREEKIVLIREKNKSF